MTPREEADLILAVDVGGTGLSGGIVDPNGTLLASHTVATDRLGRGEGILKNLLELVALLQDEAAGTRRPVRGLGIGVPGVVDMRTGAIGADIQNIPEFQDFPLGDVLRERTGLPVVVDNDVNALTLAEWTFGQGKGCRHMAMLAVGTSVGGGLVLNGALVRGASGYAGEIGHITVDVNGRACFCGSRGCVKAYVSGPDLAEQARELMKKAHAPILSGLAGGNLAHIDAPLVFTAAAQGDPVARMVVARAAQALGAGIATLINVCNPELVVLGGGVMQAGEILMEPALQWTGVYAFRRALAGTRIVRSGLSKESGVLGAAALFLYEAGRGDDPKAVGPRRKTPRREIP